jgi:nickel-dependent lactate racemase
LAGIEQSIREASGGNDPATLRDAAVASVRAALTGDQAKAEEARNRAADAIAKAQNIPVDQAKQQVAGYEKQYTDAVAQAKQQATEAAQTAATAFSAGAILAFIALTVGAIAAWVGGSVGTVHASRDDDEIYDRRR